VAKPFIKGVWVISFSYRCGVPLHVTGDPGDGVEVAAELADAH